MNKRKPAKAKTSKAPRKRTAKPKVVSAIEQLTIDRAKTKAEYERLCALPLTAKQQIFADRYVENSNATQSAIDAGYPKTSASVQGYENLRKPHIALYIKFRREEVAKRLGWDKNRVLEHLGSEVVADLADLYDENNHLKPITDWPMPFRQGLVESVIVTAEYDGRGPDRTQIGTITKLKLKSRQRSIELIGRHIGIAAFQTNGATPEPSQDDELEGLRNDLEGTALTPPDIRQPIDITPTTQEEEDIPEDVLAEPLKVRQ